MSGPRNVGPVTLAATGGGATGQALALVVVWLIESGGTDVPAPVEGALALLLGVALSVLGGWIVPGRQGDHARS